MALISTLKSTLESIFKRKGPTGSESFPIGGQQAPGQASDYEGWAPNADRDPAANVPANKDKSAG